MIRHARITGKVEYREGDGANITIRLGPIQVEETALDATISWLDEDTRGSTAIPLADFRRHVSERAIQFDDEPKAVHATTAQKAAGAEDEDEGVET
jgi:hypothetical protein